MSAPRRSPDQPQCLPLVAFSLKDSHKQEHGYDEVGLGVLLALSCRWQQLTN